MEEITKQGKKGFTDFQLKYIAMDLMILDHIEFMDGETAILVAGVAMYLTRKHRILQVICYVIVAALFDVVLPLIQ
ncbi:MAG: hypothetical protein PUC65_00415 [Clostridiales bacterium]|nr:hypothetical protein [Clostridiales bacterium]